VPETPKDTYVTFNVLSDQTGFSFKQKANLRSQNLLNPFPCQFLVIHFIHFLALMQLAGAVIIF